MKNTMKNHNSQQVGNRVRLAQIVRSNVLKKSTLRNKKLAYVSNPVDSQQNKNTQIGS